MLRESAYIRDCADLLEKSSPCLTDSTLVAWARLVMLGEETATAFSYDDIGGVATLTDVRTQMMLKDFTKRLISWRDGLPDLGSGKPLLLLMYNTMRLYLYEVALHVDYPPEDLRDPSRMEGAVPVGL